MKIAYQIIIILLVSVSCRTKESETAKKNIAQYKIDSYYSNSNEPDNFISAKYYDSSDKILREVTRDGICIQYIYNDKEQLTETRTNRSCGFGRRSMLIYDSFGNHLGNYNTLDSAINLDTISFEQTKYYDDSNRLIKEKIAERTTLNGKVIETWNLFKYEDTLRTYLEVKENDITTWHGDYKYDYEGKLIRLSKSRNERYEIDTFIYNNLGLLVEKQITNNEKIVTPKGTFDKPNRRTVFKYDSTNFLYEKTIYDDGKFVVRTVSKKTIFGSSNTP